MSTKKKPAPKKSKLLVSPEDIKEQAVNDETQLPVYDDLDAPEGLKHTDIKKPVSISVKEFLSQIYK